MNRYQTASPWGIPGPIRFDTTAIRAANPIPDYLLSRGFDLKKTGDRWVGRCPFHQERTPSFSVWVDHYHCFGCGAHGDVIDLICQLQGITFVEACRRFGVPVEVHRRTAAGSPKPVAPLRRPSPTIRWPSDLHRGTADELRELARLRHLNVEACRQADDRGVLWFGSHRGCRAWILTDEARVVAEARRLDGHLWAGTRKADALAGSRKCWLLGSKVRPGHPLSAGGGQRVALVEGTPDYLAALHWAELLGGDELLVVAVLGREVVRVAPESLQVFTGKRVRIFPHADRDPETGRAFADRWMAMAIAAGALAVSTFEVRGLRMWNGRPITDLNDAVLCSDLGRLTGVLDF